MREFIVWRFKTCNKCEAVIALIEKIIHKGYDIKCEKRYVEDDTITAYMNNVASVPAITELMPEGTMRKIEISYKLDELIINMGLT